MARIHVIYSSVGGNTELVSRTIAKTLESEGHESLLERCEKSSIHKIKEHDCLVIAAPTYGHGEPDKRFEEFLKTLNDFDLADHLCAIVGLGDSKYDDDYNMAILPLMMNFLKEKKAKIIHFPLAINKSPVPQIETRIIPWAEGLSRLLH